MTHPGPCRADEDLAARATGHVSHGLRSAFGLVLAGSTVFLSPAIAQKPAPGTPKRPSFAEVNGWRSLPWGMDVEKAKIEMGRLGIRFKEEWMRGHFATPAPPPASRAPSRPSASATQSPRPAAPSHTICATFHKLTFDQGPYQATAEFLGFALRSVSLVRRGLASQEAVLAEAKVLERQFGPPQRRLPFPSLPGGDLVHWENPSARLTVSAWAYQGKWNVILRYERLPVTWP